jgi:hypothetical protein
MMWCPDAVIRAGERLGVDFSTEADREKLWGLSWYDVVENQLHDFSPEELDQVWKAWLILAEAAVPGCSCCWRERPQ